jgi:hypothetical protein
LGCDLQISVKRSLDDTISTLDVNQSDTIRIIKGKIHKIKGILPSLQRLIFAGIELADVGTVAGYNITNGSTLNLLVRIRKDMHI